jgi:hypothetical protein
MYTLNVIILVARLTFGVCEGSVLLKISIPPLNFVNTHDPLEDRTSPSPSCVRDGSQFLTMMKPKELLADRWQPEPADCQNFVQNYTMYTVNELNRSNTW